MSSTLKKSHVLGEGGFGCVIEPAIPCKNKKLKEKMVSKLIGMKEKNTQAREEYLKEEYYIGKILNKVDPEGIFFLTVDEMCQLQHDAIQKGTMDNIKKDCFKKRGIHSTFFINMTMRKGYEFKDIFRDHIQSFENILLCIAHLILAIQIMANRTDITCMDLKHGNFLFDTSYGNYLHPLIIDFSSDYIVGYQKPFEIFIDGFKTKSHGYVTWSPGVQANLILANGEDAENIPDVMYEIYVKYKNVQKKHYDISSEMMDTIDIFQYKYGNTDDSLAPEQFDEFISDLTTTMDIIEEQQETPSLDTVTSEKIMLWQLFKTLVHISPEKIIEFGRSKNKKYRRFYELVMNQLDIDITKRMRCDVCLEHIDDMLDYDKNNDKNDRYFIKINREIIDKIIK